MTQGPAEALALVRASSSSSSADDSPRDQGSSPAAGTGHGQNGFKTRSRALSKSAEDEGDPDIRRVYQLMELHEVVKRRYGEGHDSQLDKARKEVDELLHQLKEEDNTMQQ